MNQLFKIINPFRQQSLFLFAAFLFSIHLSAQENCNNGIDDDGDGKIDLNDPDCICNTSEVTSIIPNPSFETHSGCPSSFSELSLATPWIQATGATTDYFNTCGFTAPAVTSQGLQNFPDGDGAAGAIFLTDWNEYLGATLMSPMLAGTTYQLTFDMASVMMYYDGTISLDHFVDSLEPVNVTLYGCANGTNLPLNTYFSPDSYDPTWIEIGHATYTPVTNWGQVTISFTPAINVNAVMLGAPPVLPVSYPSLTSMFFPYFVYDNLILNTAASFGINISQTGNFCENNLVLTANLTTTLSSSATYQWYLNGIAIAGATGITYNVPAFATNLGDYSVKVTDAGECYVSAKRTINNAIPSPTYTAIQPTCIVTTGSVTITTPGSEYSFDNGTTWQTSPTQSGLEVGLHYIKIKSPNGCVSSSTGINIIQPQLLAGSSVSAVQPTTCNGTGSITVNDPNAVQYSYDDGVTWTTSATANNLQPGNYMVKIKDAAGCQSGSQVVVIDRIYLASPTYSVIQPTCGTLGTISISSAAAEYSFDDGVTWSTNPVANGLVPGTYTIKIKNAAGCESFPQYVYIDVFYLNIFPSSTSVQPSCGTGGSITITTVGSEYSFDNGATWSTNPTATNLPPGSYAIQIKNELGCISYANYVYLNYFYLPNPDFTIVQPTCGVGGSITITDANATEYSFDSGTTWTTNATASNLAPGTYYILIRNALGCMSAIQYANLNYYYLPDPPLVVVNPSCGNIGSISIVATGVTEYTFDGGTTWTTNPVANNLPSGSYYIKVRNAQGCESNYVYVYLDSFYLANPNYTVAQPGCGTGGSITITTAAAQYSFDGGSTWTTNPVMNNLSPGYYYVKIQNSTGCMSDYLYVLLDTYYLPDPTYTVVDATCGVGASITINTVADQYSFDGGSTWTTNPVLSNITTEGYYYIMVKNAAGCVSNYQYVYVNQFYLPDFAFTVTQPTCGTNGSITILTAADQYSFDNGATWSTNPTMGNLAPGYYYMMVKSNLGCTSHYQYVTIDPYFLPNPTFTIVQPDCGTPGSINITTTASQYSFDGGSTWTTNPVMNNLAPGFYSIAIKNNLGCTSNVQYVNLNEFFLPQPNFTIVDAGCTGAGSITITTTADLYSFDDGFTWATNPVAANLAPGYYYIKIKMNAGCVSYTQYAYVSTTAFVPSGVTYTVTQPTDCVAANGAILFTNAASFYSIDGGTTWSANASFANLAPGQYQLCIKQSSSGCSSVPIPFFLNNNSAIPVAPTFTVVQPNCTTPSGTITITTSGNEYSFDDGATWQTTNILGNLAAGTYLLRYKNTNSCISNAASTTIVGVSIPVAPATTVVQPLCGTPGSILITTTATQYSFDDAATWSASNAISNATPGVYKIRYKNSGCPSDAAIITILPPTNIPAIPTATLAQPVTCVSPFGTITVTSAAAEFSFDNGLTYSANPVSGNLPIGTYNVKVKNSDGCESQALVVTVVAPPDFPADPTFTTIQPDCTNAQGKITITSSASEYSFDNGLTWITNTASPFINPGTYFVKVKNTLGCISNASTVVLIPYTGVTPTPTVVSPQIFCIQDLNTKTLNDIAITGSALQWYDAATGGNLIPLATVVQNNVTYFVSQSIGPCESARIPVLVNFQNTPAPTGNALQTFCIFANPVLGSININGTAINWYDASGNLLPVTTPLVDGSTYYASQTLLGCESQTTLGVTISIINSLPATDYDALVCDELNDGLETIDLSFYNGNLTTVGSTYNFFYYTSLSGAENGTATDQIANFSSYDIHSGDTFIYVRISDTSNPCYGVAKLKLTMVATPVIPIEDRVPVCENRTVTISAGLGFNSYTWSTGETTSSIIVTTPGNYSVTVTKNYGTHVCSTTKNFEVFLSNQAVITEIKIDDWTDDNNTITVMVSDSSIGDYEYSLDGIHYQDSNVFSGLHVGIYTVYVKDKNECGIADEEVFLLMYPKYFTPNGDGIQDNWQIKFSTKEPQMRIKIFDRYGKFIKELSPNGPGWDGTYNNHPLPSTDYWFLVTRENGKEYRGHFSMKR